VYPAFGKGGEKGKENIDIFTPNKEGGEGKKVKKKGKKRDQLRAIFWGGKGGLDPSPYRGGEIKGKRNFLCLGKKGCHRGGGKGKIQKRKELCCWSGTGGGEKKKRKLFLWGKKKRKKGKATTKKRKGDGDFPPRRKGRVT